MPGMYEIYDGHSDRYDELVNREDREHNLSAALHGICPWDDTVVVESGIGTGRVTRLYIDRARTVYGFDRAQHMLDQAARNLEQWRNKITLKAAEHRALPVSDGFADRFIEGWAFGHAVVDGGDRPEQISLVTDALVAEAERVCRSGGSITIIETLGTNTDHPGAPHAALAGFYDRLETHHGFVRTTVSTDYRFDSPEEAIRVCGFFFGQGMAEALRERFEGEPPAPEGAIVPEYSGIWHRSR
jgi:ubiquinone/menaquinone biosynthesis C-methylase UbiE